jgi:hypothetical protein
MLRSRSEVTMDERVGMMLAGQIATDPDTGAYVRFSSGRSQYGHAPKYILSIPIPDAQRTADKYGYVASVKVHRFRAWSDAEAIAHAQAFLTKWQRQHAA